MVGSRYKLEPLPILGGEGGEKSNFLPYDFMGTTEVHDKGRMHSEISLKSSVKTEDLLSKPYSQSQEAGDIQCFSSSQEEFSVM
jgi:hypothetical protein